MVFPVIMVAKVLYLMERVRSDIPIRKAIAVVKRRFFWLSSNTVFISAEDATDAAFNWVVVLLRDGGNNGDGNRDVDAF